MESLKSIKRFKGINQWKKIIDSIVNNYYFISSDSSKNWNHMVRINGKLSKVHIDIVTQKINIVTDTVDIISRHIRLNMKQKLYRKRKEPRIKWGIFVNGR